jgi:hypothetical protein
MENIWLLARQIACTEGGILQCRTRTAAGRVAVTAVLVGAVIPPRGGPAHADAPDPQPLAGHLAERQERTCTWP